MCLILLYNFINLKDCYSREKMVSAVGNQLKNKFKGFKFEPDLHMDTTEISFNLNCIASYLIYI
jgi:hypothetical protein